MTALPDLLRQQQMLSEQIAQARHDERLQAIAQAHELVVQHGLTINEVFPPGSRQGKKLGKVAPKYRDPATSKIWSRRGKPPKWIEGQERSQFLIYWPSQHLGVV